MEQIKLVAGENISISETEAPDPYFRCGKSVPDDFVNGASDADDKLKEINRFSADRGLGSKKRLYSIRFICGRALCPEISQGNAPGFRGGGFPRISRSSLRVEKSDRQRLVSVFDWRNGGRISKCKNLLFRGSEPRDGFFGISCAGNPFQFLENSLKVLL